MDEEELEEWLEGKPQGVGVSIASRAALRASVNLDWGNWEDREWREPLTLTSLRRLLVSTVIAENGNDEIGLKEAAFSAEESTYSVGADSVNSATSARSAFLSIRSATRSDALSAVSTLSAAHSAARSALSADFDIWPEVEWDSRFLDEGGNPTELINQRLFNIEGNDWSLSDKEKLKHVKTRHPEYTWWIDWLFAMHDGTFRNWDLAYRIATEIKDETWELGAKAVAEDIQRISHLDVTRYHIVESASNTLGRLEQSAPKAPELHSIIRVRYLFETANTTKMMASDLVQAIDLIIARENELNYPSNSKSEIVVLLEAIKNTVVRIGQSVEVNSESEADKRVEELIAQIDALNREITELQKSPSSWKKFTDVFAEESAKTINWGLRGGLVFLAGRYAPDAIEELIKLWPR